MIAVQLAQALIVTVQGLPQFSCALLSPCLLPVTDDGFTLTFHPVPGSVPASTDYEHMTNLFLSFFYFLTGSFPSQLQCHTWFKAIFHHQTCLILEPTLILASRLKNKLDSVLSNPSQPFQTFQNLNFYYIALYIF